MYDRSVVFLDLETTGATATRDRITEVGLIEVDNGRFVREWSSAARAFAVESFDQCQEGAGLG